MKIFRKMKNSLTKLLVYLQLIWLLELDYSLITHFLILCYLMSISCVANCSLI